jgi:hypothetical protein
MHLESRYGMVHTEVVIQLIWNDDGLKGLVYLCNLQLVMIPVDFLQGIFQVFLFNARTELQGDVPLFYHHGGVIGLPQACDLAYRIFDRIGTA